MLNFELRKNSKKKFITAIFSKYSQKIWKMKRLSIIKNSKNSEILKFYETEKK